MNAKFSAGETTQDFIGEFHGKELSICITCYKDQPDESVGYAGSDWELVNFEIDGVKLEAVTRRGEAVERLHDKLIAIFEAELDRLAEE